MARESRVQSFNASDLHIVGVRVNRIGKLQSHGTAPAEELGGSGR